MSYTGQKPPELLRLERMGEERDNHGWSNLDQKAARWALDKIEELKDNLRRYGHHDKDCPGWNPMNECSCHIAVLLGEKPDTEEPASFISSTSDSRTRDVQNSGRVRDKFADDFAARHFSTIDHRLASGFPPK